jgi:glycosyltransferase involved in cell wall biosynthesis
MSGFEYSVIVPYYENDDTIRRALDSLVEQEPQPSQVLICDDASSPASAASLRAEVAQHPLASRIRVLTHEVNQGPGAARNTAWAEVTTPWVCFLDADDAWHPERTAVQRQYLEDHPGITMLGTEVAVRAESDPQPHATTPSAVGVMKVDLRRQLVRNRFATSSVTIRSATSERFDPSMRYAEDHDLWTRILLKGNAAAVLRASLTYAYKPPFGHSGASSRLLRMHQGSLHVLRRIRSRGTISRRAYVLLAAFSWLRFFRRVTLTVARRARLEERARGPVVRRLRRERTG